MKLEQRIGRIDRIGQARPVVKVINLFYDDTAEKDAYEITEARLRDITRNVGRYRPILSNAINAAIAKETRGEITREQMRATIETHNPTIELDIDEFNSDIAMPPEKPANIDAERLLRSLFQPHLLPNGYAIESAEQFHWRIIAPSGESCEVTYDTDAYADSNDSVEWWGPGHPAFPSH